MILITQNLLRLRCSKEFMSTSIIVDEFSEKDAQLLASLSLEFLKRPSPAISTCNSNDQKMRRKL